MVVSPDLLLGQFLFLSHPHGDHPVITLIRISLSWAGTTPHPILSAGVHNMAEIMPAVLASHGLEMPDELSLEPPLMAGPVASFHLMILAIEAPRNRTEKPVADRVTVPFLTMRYGKRLTRSCRRAQARPAKHKELLAAESSVH
jgi:hypothetical protein